MFSFHALRGMPCPDDLRRGMGRRDAERPLAFHAHSHALRGNVLPPIFNGCVSFQAGE